MSCICTCKDPLQDCRRLQLVLKGQYELSRRPSEQGVKARTFRKQAREQMPSML